MTRIAAIVYSNYPHDNRVRREAETLVEANMSVDVICLRREGELSEEIMHGVSVHRIAIKKERGGKLSYIVKYFTFLVLAFAKLSILHFRERYDIVHIHNMPDFLVFAALLPKLGGSMVMLDLHDPVPELYMTKYSIGEDSSIIRLMKLLEKWSIRFADRVITTNIAFRDLFISRGCPADKISIVMNCPVEKIFQQPDCSLPDSGDGHADRFVLMYHGAIFERHGLDTALDALVLLRDRIPRLEFRVFGVGDFTDQFLELVDKHGLRDVVKYGGLVSWETIFREIRTIDIGIIPNKRSPFTEINMPVRIFEYLCLGKPVIVPRTKGILDYFDEDSIFFFEAGNAGSLAERIFEIYKNPTHTQQLIERGRRVYDSYRWELQGRHLVELVNGLMDRKHDPNQPHGADLPPRG